MRGLITLTAIALGVAAAPAQAADVTIKNFSFMTGKVVVNGPAGPDTTPPKISNISTTGGRKCRKGQKHCKGRPTTLRFKLSEPATVKVRVPKHKAANVTRSAKAGSNKITLSTSKLPPGKWTLNVSA